MVETNIQIEFAKLTAKFESMDKRLEKLDEIEKNMKDLIHVLNNNHTDLELVKQQLGSIIDDFKSHKKETKKRFDETDNKIEELEKKQNWLTSKVAIILTVGGFILTWIYNKIIR